MLESVLLKNAIHLTCIWVTAICVFAQSVGAAAGAVLCLGCTDTADSWGGISVTNAPCTPVNDCCAQADGQHDSHLKGQTNETKPDCGCFDIKLKAHDGTLAHSQPKIIVTFSHFLTPAAEMLATLDNSLDPSILFAIRGRDGPPSVRLLAPLARRTVLLN